MIDFYDSFTYNLVHYLEGFDLALDVIRFDEIDHSLLPHYDAFVLSPGPGLPKDKEGLFSFLEQMVGRKPILGVCLGMQALTEYLGGSLENQELVKHGCQEVIDIHVKSGLFKNLPDALEVGLYHSWKVKCPKQWITASSKTKVPMAIELPKKKVYGVQFHPESIMTPHGKEILHNFIQIVRIV